MRIIALLLFAYLPFCSKGQTTTNLPPWPITQVWGGGRHTIALLADGSVWTWGSDVSGKLGDNQVSASYSDSSHDSHLPLRVHGPGNVSYLNSIIAISAGEGHNLALKSDGTVWAWGWNGVAQLGNGTTNDAHTPVQVIGVSNVVAISGRGYHCLALESNGSLWAWGWNAGGQLGDGTTTTALLPQRVAGITNPAMISAGYKISLILLTNGTVKVWGTDTYGELGQGTIGGHSYSPVLVPGISNVVFISAGFQNPEALLSDGSIWMWGWGAIGQLGDGSATNRAVAGPVLNFTNMVFAGLMTNMIYAGQTGDRDNCAIRADHTVWTWGRNYNGQLGIGTTNDIVPYPVQVPAFGRTNVVMVQTPDWHSLALEADSTLWGWGSNDHGQLGNNTTNDAWSPTPVLWPLISAAPIAISGLAKPAGGAFQFTFTNNPGARFTVLMTTDLALPLANWTPIGSALEVFPGQFQFSDPQATNDAARFYRVRSP